MNNSQWSTKSIVNNLIMLNVVMFLIQVIPSSSGFGEQMTHYLGLHSFFSSDFRLYQLVTYMFLHGGFTHLFFNMFALWMFGRITEYDLGGKRFLIFYMATGIGAAVLNLIVNGIEIHAAAAGSMEFYRSVQSITIGASGAVFGILLAFGLMHPNERIILLIPPIPMKAKYFVIIYGVLELFLGIRGGDGIAHFAHLGGMIFAFILLKYWKAKGKIYF